jgi:hypothetical protein
VLIYKSPKDYVWLKQKALNKVILMLERNKSSEITQNKLLKICDDGKVLIYG